MKFQPFTIGKYEFVEFLGRGGMAEVYRVCLTGPKGFQKEFAVKRVLPGFITDPEVIRMFEAEAHLTSMLNHANIVQVFEFIKSGANYFLVMEYIHGKNLASLLNHLRLRNKRVPEDIALYIIQKICEGLDYAHNKKDPRTGASLNIIHRDISPHNIMLSFEGGVKIVDFGIAKARTSSTDTRTGTTKGKLAYMSPEQALGKQLDPRSDIFSTSALLYELLTQRKLFEAENEMQVIRLVQDCAIPNLGDTLAELPMELLGIIQKGLAPTPQGRYQSISEMQRAIQSFLHKTYPEIGQRRLADWLADSFTHFEDNHLTGTLEITPLSISEENFMKDGFAKLEEALYEKNSFDKPKSSHADKPIPEVKEAQASRRTFEVLLGVMVIGLASAAIGVLVTRRTENRLPSSQVSKKEVVTNVPVVTEPAPKVSLMPSLDKNLGAVVTPTSTPTVLPTPVSSVPTPKPTAIPRTETLKPKIEKKMAKPVAKAKVKEVPPATKPPVAAAPKPTEVTPPEADSTVPSDFDRLSASVSNSASSSVAIKSKNLYEQGMEAFKNGKFEEANGLFSQSRKLKSNYLPAWLYEIKSLEKLNRPEAAREVVEILISTRPEAKNSPVVAPYLKH